MRPVKAPSLSRHSCPQTCAGVYGSVASSIRSYPSSASHPGKLTRVASSVIPPNLSACSHAGSLDFSVSSLTVSASQVSETWIVQRTHLRLICFIGITHGLAAWQHMHTTQHHTKQHDSHVSTAMGHTESTTMPQCTAKDSALHLQHVSRGKTTNFMKRPENTAWLKAACIYARHRWQTFTEAPPVL